MEKSHPLRKRWAVLAAVIVWFAVGTQLYLTLQQRVNELGETLIRFLSYFTILTNTLVACYFSATALKKPRSLWFRFFARPGTLTAITIYILVVGLVYQVVLRSLWEPAGLQRLTDELLHSFNPLLVLIFWISFEEKGQLHWKQVPLWMIYPLLYLAFILARGGISSFYPYPFVDVGELGLSAVLVNSLYVCGLFLILSAVFVLVGKGISKYRR